MKKHLKSFQLRGLVLIAVMAIVSCSKEEGQQTQEQESFDLVELKASDESELISEEIINIGEDVYSTDEIRTTSRGLYTSDYLPSCVTITTVLTETSKKKTIDFGTGCELPNGNVLSGIISMSYAKDMVAASKTLDISLENFTFNNVAVTGSVAVERLRANDNGNPEAVAIGSFEAVWPDGETASFTGNRTREWIEGYGSGFWGDNVVLISGKRTYNGKQGNVFVKETITPLRREWSCRFLVSGIVEISKNENTATLDFGDGSCDAIGTLTYPNGSSQEIFLRRFKNN